MQLRNLPGIDFTSVPSSIDLSSNFGGLYFEGGTVENRALSESQSEAASGLVSDFDKFEFSFGVSVFFIDSSTGCRVFKRGVQNWKDYCLKINISKGNC